MDRMRKELIELATGMPEPGIWTGYIVLRTVKEVCDAAERDVASSRQSQRSNVIDMRTRRSPVLKWDENDLSTPFGSRHVQYLADVAQSDFVARGMGHAQELCRQIACAEAKGHPTEIADDLFHTFLQSLGLIRALKEKVSRLETGLPDS